MSVSPVKVTNEKIHNNFFYGQFISKKPPLPGPGPTTWHRNTPVLQTFKQEREEKKVETKEFLVVVVMVYFIGTTITTYRRDGWNNKKIMMLQFVSFKKKEVFGYYYFFKWFLLQTDSGHLTRYLTN